jgi:sulfite dehydrogenase (cytochrome) subunit B
MKNAWFVIALLALAVAGAGSAHNSAQAPTPSPRTIELPPDNAMATLKPGPGLDVVESNCASCHSTDYIVRQPGDDAKHWEPEIHKMMTVYGVKISDSDFQTIVNYLGAEYGPPAVTGSGQAPKLPASPSLAPSRHPANAAERQ